MLAKRPRLNEPKAATTERLSSLLAERVMGWGIGPNSFLMGGRHWLLRWRFRPAQNLARRISISEGSQPRSLHDGLRREIRVLGPSGNRRCRRGSTPCLEAADDYVRRRAVARNGCGAGI